MQLPSVLRDAIERETSRYPLKQLTEAAIELSSNYRRSSPARISSDAQRRAYLAVRMPATYAALHKVFANLQSAMAEANFQSLLDLGAGPGTTAWAALSFFDRIERFTLFEQDPEWIRLGKSLAGNSENHVFRTADWQTGSLDAVPAFTPHDLVVCSYSLGEIEREIAVKIVRAAWQSAQQALVIVEPGTLKGFHLIRSLREELIRLDAFIVAPCPHPDTCPMPEGDWCHFRARCERSSLHRRLKSAALGYEDEKFAYIAASKPPARPATSRVIRHPIHQTGCIRLELCTREQLQTVRIKRSDKAAWKHARKIAWGDEWDPI